MEKILGIDTGTNSLGWAIVEKSEDGYKLLDKGVNIGAGGFFRGCPLHSPN